MQIYTIREGDTLFNIARAFNSTVSDIVSANELPNPQSLVIGQTIVIPIYGSYYFVQPGDSLWLIARRFGLNYTELARINGIDANSALNIGQRLYIPPMPKVAIETNAYIESVGETLSLVITEDLQRANPYLTYLALFSYQANRDGTLTPPPNIQQIIDLSAQASPMMVITNIEQGEFSAELARDILQSEAVTDLLIQNIIGEAERVGVFSDIHFDFEFIPPETRQLYNNFLAKAAPLLRERGFLVSSALAPKVEANQPGQWYEGHDYKAHGKLMDFVIIMTYEWGFSGGPPLPVSPINEVERVLRYALTEIPASKIMMGQNLYGYDWTLPFVEGGQFARAVSPQQAIEIARRFNAEIFFDTTAQAPFFDYTDENGAAHKVWFEDARSIQSKFNLLKNLGLRGISYWKLGLPFPQNWLLLSDNFDIIRR
ncbi:MAG: glycoside hydrolase family 18 protein [Clostridia bacterium]|nr:glycoside hydrolase family 18 protein [Clostridia bacterium]